MTTIDKSDNNYVYYLVGKNIRKYRKLKGLKQRELADKCSLSEGFISDIESNTFRTISLNTLYHIAKVLDIHIMLLFQDLDEDSVK